MNSLSVSGCRRKLRNRESEEGQAYVHPTIDFEDCMVASKSPSSRNHGKNATMKNEHYSPVWALFSGRDNACGRGAQVLPGRPYTL
jgi:hypothetical protein